MANVLVFTELHDGKVKPVTLEILGKLAGQTADVAVIGDIAEFSEDEVASLKAAYPTWRHPFTNAGRRFAKNVLKMEVKTAERTIQVVDVRNSKLCPVLESGETYPGCEEILVYKPATTYVKEVTVSKK